MLFQNIVRKCNEEHISIRTLERICGIGNGTIYKWQNSSPSIEKVKAVADYFGCAVDELLKED